MTYKDVSLCVEAESLKAVSGVVVDKGIAGIKQIVFITSSTVNF